MPLFNPKLENIIEKNCLTSDELILKSTLDTHKKWLKHSHTCTFGGPQQLVSRVDEVLDHSKKTSILSPASLDNKMQ